MTDNWLDLIDNGHGRLVRNPDRPDKADVWISADYDGHLYLTCGRCMKPLERYPDTLAQVSLGEWWSGVASLDQINEIATRHEAEAHQL